MPAAPLSGRRYGQPVNEGDRNGYGRDDRRDLASREQRIEQRIGRAYEERTISYRERNRALTELADIKRDHRRLTDRYGRISPRGEQQLQARLDQLNDGLRAARQDNRNR